ncbi:hypothetical protein I4F81_012350 [Pyropia yezoensis]|uniref:Uncharacterized protein n=1 Tax=Pyropia yezoensis TaxID=2788 RepID=A0ACC3CIV6_PYRYE|nr:hypothetical protein I4F81_012350 [Neopyropia yezoensis]
MAFVGSPAALPSAGRAVPRLSARSSAFVAAAPVVRSSTTAAAAGQTRVVSMATPPRRNRSKFDDNKVASTYDALGAPPAIRSRPRLDARHGDPQRAARDDGLHPGLGPRAVDGGKHLLAADGPMGAPLPAGRPEPAPAVLTTLPVLYR